MATIKKKAQAGTSIKKSINSSRDISDVEFKKYGNTESQLAGKKIFKIEVQKNTPNAFVDYKTMNSKKELSQKKHGGKVMKKKCCNGSKISKKGKK